MGDGGFNVDDSSGMKQTLQRYISQDQQVLVLHKTVL